MNCIENSNTRYVLWTGGVDSTFMLLQFARQELKIQPIYVIDPERKSTQYEIKAMNSIIRLLETKYANDVRALIMPIIIYELKDIKEDNQITKYYNELSLKMKIGSQYEWLARLATMYPHLEIGVEKHIHGYGGCTSAIVNNGGFIEKDGMEQLNTAQSSEDIIALFGNYRFPILHYTGEDMLTLVHSWGWDEIMQHTWFCHNPINEKPCGLCRPCQQKMEDQMELLLPVSARRRYKMFSWVKKTTGEEIANKAVSLYRRIRK